MRLARIYTGWWPWCLLYLLGATLWQWPLSTAHLAASVWLAPLPEIGQYLLPILWSLAFELYFYAVTAVLLLLPRRWMRAGLAAWGLGIVGLGLWHLGQGHYTPAFEAQIGMVQRFWGSPLVLEFIGALFPQGVVDAVASLSFLTHFAAIAKGVVDLRDVLFFLLVIAFWLAACALVIDLKKAD